MSTDKFFTYRGDVRAVAVSGGSLAFVTVVSLRAEPVMSLEVSHRERGTSADGMIVHLDKDSMIERLFIDHRSLTPPARSCSHKERRMLPDSSRS